MSIELFYLAIYAFVIIITILLQQLTSIANVGLWPVFGSREGIRFTGMTGRLERAVTNSVIAMCLFAPAVLILHAMQISTNQTAAAVQIFVISRIVYSISYGLNILGLRSLCWIVSLICIIILLFNGAFPPGLTIDE